MTISAHKTEGVNRIQTMRSHPFVFLPERMRTACDRSGANGNGASSRGTRRTDNARGQLETRRFLCWTEDVAAQSERRASLLAFPSQSSVGAANRLQAFMEQGDEGGIAAWYNYTAAGERNFKFTSPRLNMQQNASVMNAPSLIYPTLYASPLITLTKYGYTKHYFEEGRRVCSKLGGGFLRRVAEDEIHKPVEEIKYNYEEQHKIQQDGVRKTFGSCIGVDPRVIDDYDLLRMILEYRSEEKPFFYHSDHLGSAAYLTSGGHVTQTLNYLPYGEDWIDIQNNLDPQLGQYTFNGKEKDYESGFHYYGARYYWSEVLTGWLSVDPMMDKYPSISPYAYCMWNPVKLVDPDGREIDEWQFNLLTGEMIKTGNGGGKTHQTVTFVNPDGTTTVKEYEGNAVLLDYRNEGGRIDYKLQVGNVPQLPQCTSADGLTPQGLDLPDGVDWAMEIGSIIMGGASGAGYIPSGIESVGQYIESYANECRGKYNRPNGNLTNAKISELTKEYRVTKALGRVGRIGGGLLSGVGFGLDVYNTIQRPTAGNFTRTALSGIALGVGIFCGGPAVAAGLILYGAFDASFGDRVFDF